MRNPPSNPPKNASAKKTSYRQRPPPHIKLTRICICMQTYIHTCMRADEQSCKRENNTQEKEKKCFNPKQTNQRKRAPSANGNGMEMGSFVYRTSGVDGMGRRTLTITCTYIVPAYIHILRVLILEAGTRTETRTALLCIRDFVFDFVSHHVRFCI